MSAFLEAARETAQIVAIVLLSAIVRYQQRRIALLEKRTGFTLERKQ